MGCLLRFFNLYYVKVLIETNRNTNMEILPKLGEDISRLFIRS